MESAIQSIYYEKASKTSTMPPVSNQPLYLYKSQTTVPPSPGIYLLESSLTSPELDQILTTIPLESRMGE